MAGFTEPNQYEPRAGWRRTLAEWAQSPPGNEASWQHQIGMYWRWRTVNGLWLREAWEELGMKPATARATLVDSMDSGLIPPEVFSRLLARSQATSVNPESNVANVVIAPTPPTELPAAPEVGYTPPSSNPPRPALYQPRKDWRGKLANPPGLVANWVAELHVYWRRRTKLGQDLETAWKGLKFHPTNAATALHNDHVDRGSIPPEIIGRVVARSQGNTDPDANVDGIILYPELSV